MLEDVINEFNYTNPDFVGAKVIYTLNRNFSNHLKKQKMEHFMSLRKSHPKLVMGFDFVGQEDLVSLVQLKQYLDQLPNETRFFLHAGETSKYFLDFLSLSFLLRLIALSRLVGIANRFESY